MRIIGFDFGTTNSTISYFNEESGTLDSFKINEKDLNYIPTVVAYNKNENNEVSIGVSAKRNMTLKNFEAYEHFKLRLGKNFNAVIEGKTKTPSQVTYDFIETLLKQYKKEQKVGDIDGIVMTVPETWFRESSNRTSMENIEGMFKKLGYGEHSFQLESEPVGAAAYFCWAYEHDKEKNPRCEKYTGAITVVDFGGGTLDVTLCQVLKDGTIKILERCGFGEYNKTNGCAGVAFDEAVVEKLIKDRNLPIQKGTPGFLRLRAKFEDAKITECDAITRGLKYYYDNKRIKKGKPLFSLEDDRDGEDAIDVFCEDLDQCFEKVNAPKLTDSLNQIKQFFEIHNIDGSAQKNFKVLLVGGFSNFFAVEKVVREAFDTTTEELDERFNQPFPKKNRALSISRGAALIAKKVILVEHACTYSYGYIVASKGEADRMVDKYVAVIDKGTDVKLLDKPVYKEKEKSIQILDPQHGIRIYIDDGLPNGRLPLGLDESVRDLFPNVNDPGNEYRIGFTISRNRVPTIHIKDKRGDVKSTSLYKLFERLAIIEK